ncbi:NifB/NifX family molybdenum-iron cluster-binding protein [Azoarcus taiwanensis]|uniref:Nitrogen fixation protein n=1 Tax=Azoarcus taiwanensis TaxID=666964 RepID=A0A972F7G6_9RHOO|nr:NifB/NifX family molybdenum-iron cluster-binding protein [Azoarcus taiwanensis]NMG03214.1 nitrogen fixation protein [Azoarcus taiwanensis]
MKIAVTSQNFRTVTAHAGKTRRFLVFDIPSGESPREVDRLDLPQEMAFRVFRGDQHPIDGVAALITGGAGEGFRARMGRRGIELVVTSETDPLQAVIDYTRGVVKPAALHAHGHHGAS